MTIIQLFLSGGSTQPINAPRPKAHDSKSQHLQKTEARDAKPQMSKAVKPTPKAKTENLKQRDKTLTPSLQNLRL